MSNDSKPFAWQLLLLPMIPAVGVGVGVLINRLGGDAAPVDPAFRALAAQLIARRVALDAHLNNESLRTAPAETPQGAAELAAYAVLTRGPHADPGELTRRAHSAALRAGVARQATIDATLDAMRTAWGTHPGLADRRGAASRQASLAALRAGESAALAALAHLPPGANASPPDLFQRAYSAALDAGNEAIERALVRAA